MISVILPYKNAEPWIERAIKSMKIQKGDLEFILVNDASEDKSKTVAKKAAGKDKRFVFAENKREPGVSGARNTGLDMAKGEWITFLDADDEFVPEAGEVFVRMTQLQQEPNIIQANQLRYYEKSGKLKPKWTNKRGIYCPEHLPVFWCMVWNKLYRRSFIEEHGIRFIEGLQYGEDEIFNLDCLAHDGRIFHTLSTTMTTIHHFENKESLSHTKGKEGLMEQAKAIMNFIERCEEPAVRIAACKTLSEHWGSYTYLTAFGGNE